MITAAVLDHLRVAMAAAGWHAGSPTSHPNDLDHLASSTSPRSISSPTPIAPRADAILRRRTDRLPFAAAELGEIQTTGVAQHRRHRVGGPARAADGARPQLAEASRLTESLRRYDSYYHARWNGGQHLSRSRRRPVQHPGITAGRTQSGWEIARAFPRASIPTGARRSTTTQSKILALSTYSDSRRDALPWLRRGALQRAAGGDHGRVGHLHPEPPHRAGGQPRDPARAGSAAPTTRSCSSGSVWCRRWATCRQPPAPTRCPTCWRSALTVSPAANPSPWTAEAASARRDAQQHPAGHQRGHRPGQFGAQYLPGSRIAIGCAPAGGSGPPNAAARGTTRPRRRDLRRVLAARSTDPRSMGDRQGHHPVASPIQPRGTSRTTSPTASCCHSG